MQTHAWRAQKLFPTQRTMRIVRQRHERDQTNLRQQAWAEQLTGWLHESRRDCSSLRAEAQTLRTEALRQSLSQQMSQMHFKVLENLVLKASLGAASAEELLAELSAAQHRYYSTIPQQLQPLTPPFPPARALPPLATVQPLPVAARAAPAQPPMPQAPRLLLPPLPARAAGSPLLAALPLSGAAKRKASDDTGAPAAKKAKEAQPSLPSRKEWTSLVSNALLAALKGSLKASKLLKKVLAAAEAAGATYDREAFAAKHEARLHSSKRFVLDDTGRVSRLPRSTS